MLRRLPLLVSGMLLLPLGLLVPGSAALAADTAPEPEPSVSVSVPADGEDPGDGEEDPEDDFLSGVFTSTPATGPAGTKLSVASKDKCVDADGVVGPKVDVVLFNLGNADDLDDLTGITKKAAKAAAAEDDEDLDLDYVDKVVDTDKDGAWKTTIAVPDTAETGDYFVVIAGCFAEGVDPQGEESEPFLIYEPLDFTVTGAPEAPPAEPVPGDPSFTG